MTLGSFQRKHEINCLLKIRQFEILIFGKVRRAKRSILIMKQDSAVNEQISRKMVLVSKRMLNSWLWNRRSSKTRAN